MSRAPSEKTQLRTAERVIKQLRAEVLEVRRERDAYRSRATQAEQQVAEWKARFDALLQRMPKESP